MNIDLTIFVFYNSLLPTECAIFLAGFLVRVNCCKGKVHETQLRLVVWLIKSETDNTLPVREPALFLSCANCHTIELVNLPEDFLKI